MKYSHLKDVLGNDIKQGSYIVYGAAKGRCAGLNIGRVVKTEEKDDDCPGRKYLKVTVASIQVSWGEYTSSGSGWDGKGKPRKTTLSFAERMCVVSPDSVSQELKDLLDY